MLSVVASQTLVPARQAGGGLLASIRTRLNVLMCLGAHGLRLYFFARVAFGVYDSFG
jgi:hypothetical protein